MTQIDVVDIFAGPGGLGEGFARYTNEQSRGRRFQIRLSIEKDVRAHETLKLRSFSRQFSSEELPRDYYTLLKDFNRPINERLAVPLPDRPGQMLWHVEARAQTAGALPCARASENTVDPWAVVR